tara:strand:- start:1010 stop:3034 length:2025 start_codon:yes stop_codon:yes gene_type:complete
MKTEEFSSGQLEFIQSEFDRQREMISQLGKNESRANSELEEIKGSISYKIGRALTFPIRKILRINGKRRRSGTKLDDESFEIFPKLLISPDLVPKSREESFGRSTIQGFLIQMSNSRQSSNEIRDLLLRKTKGLSEENIKGGVFSITRYILSNAGFKSHRKSFFVGAMRFFVLKEQSTALEYYEEFGGIIKDQRADVEYIKLMMKMGEMKRPFLVLGGINQSSWKKRTQETLTSQLDLLENDFDGEVYFGEVAVKESGNVLYCASQCQPYTTNGYAIRTHEIAKSIRERGRKITVCARHGYPIDREDFQGVFSNEEIVIDDIPYKFNISSKGSMEPDINYNKVFNFSSFSEYQDVYSSTLFSQAIMYRPEIIHAASNFVVGMAAVNVAKAMGIPSIYEIRGFWHETQASKRFGYMGSDHYNLSESMEVEVAKRADHVLTITKSISDILIEYGIDEGKISVLPNCVDPSKFEPMQRDILLEEKYELFDKVVIGYIGSFVEYEGLDILFKAISKVKDSLGEYLKVLMVGDGPEMENLEKMSKELGISELVTFTGRIPHHEVARHYSVIDITPFPRKGRRVCEIVSPLKPFEALAMGKTVIVSNVGALSEIITHGETGLVHKKDDAASLSECIAELVLDHKVREKLSNGGRDWVIKNRTWEMAGGIIEEAYQKIIDQ